MHWLVYSKLLVQDKHEADKEARDKIEYMACFIDSKAVRQARAMRESEENRSKISDDEFNDVLKQNFGRSITSFTPVEIPVKELGRQINQASRG